MPWLLTLLTQSLLARVFSGLFTGNGRLGSSRLGGGGPCWTAPLGACVLVSFLQTRLLHSRVYSQDWSCSVLGCVSTQLGSILPVFPNGSTTSVPSSYAGGRQGPFSGSPVPCRCADGRVSAAPRAAALAFLSATADETEQEILFILNTIF